MFNYFIILDQNACTFMFFYQLQQALLFGHFHICEHIDIEQAFHGW